VSGARLTSPSLPAVWRSQQAELQRKTAELRTAGKGFLDAIHQTDLTSAVCMGFPEQPPNEQRRLLHLLLERVSWRDGQLETTFRQPFAALRLSNSATNRRDGDIGTGKPNLEDCLLIVDTFRTRDGNFRMP
jgi:hypothetical protein